MGHGLLEFMEDFRSCLGSGEISFFEAIGDGGGDGAENFYEPSIEGDKSMKAMDFLEVLGFGPIKDGLDLFGVHGDSFG